MEKKNKKTGRFENGAGETEANRATKTAHPGTRPDSYSPPSYYANVIITNAMQKLGEV